MTLATIRLSTSDDALALTDIWRRAVLATHHFLSREHFIEIENIVANKYLPDTVVYVAVDENDTPLGFIGVTVNHIDTLFIDPAAHGQGIGKTMIDYITALCATDMTVDVNEQNPNAVGFYRHLGFVQTGRAEFDPDGRPYPILHFCRKY